MAAIPDRPYCFHNIGLRKNTAVAESQGIKNSLFVL